MARHAAEKRISRFVLVLAIIAAFGAIGPGVTSSHARLSWLEQIPLETYERMREVERYQLGIAEKHYLGGEYKVALSEYEKFLTLYEASPGAPYAQLMWSHCQVKLRKVNTGIRDGFQSVIDYWPDSKEAVLAAFLIPKSYQDIGEVEKAESAYGQLIDEYPDGQIAVLARVNLLEMARTRKDEEARLGLLEDLTFRIRRTEQAKRFCEEASRELGTYYLYRAEWEKGIEALETSYQDAGLTIVLYDIGRGAASHLNREEETREAGKAMADKLIARLNASIPTDLESGDAKRQARDWLNRVAAVHGSMGKPDQVLATYERIGKLLGVDDGLRGQMAAFFKGQDEREKARDLYRKYDNQVEGTRQLAGMLREEGKHKEAIDLYRELINQDPDRVNDYLWVIAECHESLGEWKNAIQTYRQADRWPSNYFRMATCHRRLKEYNEALVLYNQVKADNGSGAEAMIQSAYTYEEAGQKENAIKAFQLTCRTHPKSGQASRAHAHLQNKYDINVTLGGAKDE